MRVHVGCMPQLHQSRLTKFLSCRPKSRAATAILLEPVRKGRARTGYKRAIGQVEIN